MAPHRDDPQKPLEGERAPYSFLYCYKLGALISTWLSKGDQVSRCTALHCATCRHGAHVNSSKSLVRLLLVGLLFLSDDDGGAARGFGVSNIFSFQVELMEETKVIVMETDCHDRDSIRSLDTQFDWYDDTQRPNKTSHLIAVPFNTRNRFDWDSTFKNSFNRINQQLYFPQSKWFRHFALLVYRRIVWWCFNFQNSGKTVNLAPSYAHYHQFIMSPRSSSSSSSFNDWIRNR